MTAEERADVSNGIWLCSNCHIIIDQDVDKYTTAYLKEKKEIAEQRAKDEIGVGTKVRGNTRSTLQKERLTVHGFGNHISCAFLNAALPYNV